MNLRRILLTLLITLELSRAASGQVQGDPYSQPPLPGANGGFRFGTDPNAPPVPAPQPMQPVVNRYQQPPPGQQPYAPPPLPPPPMMQPGQFAPPPMAPAVAPPVPPPVNALPANAQAPLIPGFDPSLSSATAPALQGSALFQPSQIIATVGNQYILYGDVAPTVEQMMRPALANAKSDEERQQMESFRPRLIQQVARQMIEAKILYLEFEREIESKAGRDKMPEVRQEMSKRLRTEFEKQLFATREIALTATPEKMQELSKKDPTIARLAVLMKEHQCENLNDLDRVLRDYGSSLEKQQRAFTDTYLGKSNLFEKIKVKSEVSHLEMLNYYREHAEDFAVKAKARFEILSVKFASFPTKEAAHQAIVNMGNEVYFGTPFAAVARKGSQDPNADKGGVYDWTTENSLASEVINRAIFNLEVGKLSPILEDERGLHIIRVTERQQAGYIPFADAQVKIKDLIELKRREVAYRAFLETLKGKTVIWTIYDEPPAAGNLATQPGAATQR